MDNWISIEDLKPSTCQLVYVVCERTNYNNKGKVRYQTMAQYVPAMTIPEEDFMHPDYGGEGDYNELEDIYYTPEGFYEYQTEADINYKISATVTHWRPLLKLPE